MENRFDLLGIFEDTKGKYQDKAAFIAMMKQRTFQGAVRVIKLCDAIPQAPSNQVIIYQVVKSATSVGNNYRAACRARSQNEFYSKMCIVVEEADETQYWLQTMQATEKGNQEEVEALIKEYTEILAVCATAKDNTYKNIKRK